MCDSRAESVRSCHHEVTLSNPPMTHPKSPDRDLVLQAAAGLEAEALVEILQRAYEGYAIALQFGLAELTALVEVHDVDLGASVVAVRGSRAVAVALVARRGDRERLAAFGVVEDERGRGVGRWLCGAVLDASRSRSCISFELEVLDQNSAAVALYRSMGLVVQGPLSGFTRNSLGVEPWDAGREADAPQLVVAGASEVAEAVAREGVRMPWQVAPEAVARTRGVLGFRCGTAYAAVRQTDDGAFRVLALTTGRAPDEADLARLIETLQARYPDRHWLVPAVFPDEPYRSRLERLGFVRTDFAQLHMAVHFTR